MSKGYRKERIACHVWGGSFWSRTNFADAKTRLLLTPLQKVVVILREYGNSDLLQPNGSNRHKEDLVPYPKRPMNRGARDAGKEKRNDPKKTPPTGRFPFSGTPGLGLIQPHSLSGGATSWRAFQILCLGGGGGALDTPAPFYG